MMTHQELAQALLDWVSADTKNRSVVAVLSTDKDPTDNEYTSSFVMVGSKMLTIRGLAGALEGKDDVRTQFKIALELAAEMDIYKKPDIAKEIAKPKITNNDAK